MSKLVDRLERVDQMEPAPMGFGAVAGHGQKRTPVVLIGRVESDKLTKDTSLADADVDAVLVWFDDLKERSISKVARTLKGRLWGVRANDIKEATVEKLKEKGCDFIVLHGDDTDAAVLNDGDLGKFISIDADMTEDMARALHDLPFDGAMFSPDQDLLPLTLGKLISIQQVRGMVAKPFLMATPTDLGASDLKVILNAGIIGLVMEAPSAEEVALIKETASKLPHRRPGSGASALVPQVSGLAEPAGGGEEDDGDDDDF